MTNAIPACPKCAGTSFFNMPDSLAYACRVCGFVWVHTAPGEWEPGVDILTWAKDVYGKKP